MPHGYLVALFDILGFERKLADIGLAEMLTRYEALIDVVNHRKEHIKRIFGDLGFVEAPHWTAEGSVFFFNEIRGAYASDSILLWMNRTWPKARGMTLEECNAQAGDPAIGWTYQPIPCDNFFDVCNDIMCRSLEIGLPLRGAISIGDAILDEERQIFLGQPIVEAARLEKGQKFIGASLCMSAIKQMIPKRFTLPFDKHIKDSFKEAWGSVALDWPRHWRKTRTTNLVDVITLLDTHNGYSAYYKNTLDFIAHSKQFENQFENCEDTSIRSVYKQFAWSNSQLAVLARPVRRVPTQPNSK